MEIRWYTTLAEAKAEARRTQKPVLIDFFDPG
jgi:hypothetical protein